MHYEDKQRFQEIVNQFVEQHPNVPLVKLFVKSSEQQFNAFVEVSWCIEPILHEWLHSNNIPNPHIVLVDTLDNRPQQTKVVPLSQGSTFISFNRGGEHSVHAALCFGYDKPRAIVKKYESRDLWDWYDNQFDAKEFDGYFEETRGEMLNLNIFCEVNVSKEMFAKEPNKHLLYFVNLWYESYPRDQCHYRRRLILLCTLKIWPIILWTMGSVVFRSIEACMLVLIGMHKQIRWPAILRVWEYSLEQLADVGDLEEKWNWYPVVRDRRGDIVGVRPLSVLFLTVLNPILHFMITPLTCLMVGGLADFMSLYGEVTMVLLFVISLGIITVAGAVGVYLVGCYVIKIDPLEKLKHIVDNMLHQKDTTEDVKNKIAQRSLKHISQVQCPSDVNGEYIAPLPVDTIQRITLQYERIKAKVCKPFPK